MRPNLREQSSIEEIHVVWITAGLSCDGDTIAVTGAREPSLEDILGGVLPGLPRVILHNPVLAVENGDDFMETLHRAVVGGIENMVLVVEGSIPNEQLCEEG